MFSDNILEILVNEVYIITYKVKYFFFATVLSLLSIAMGVAIYFLYFTFALVK